MASPPYPEVEVSGSDDETFQFVLSFESNDGTAFPFEEYDLEYSLVQNCARVLHLTQGNGITIDGQNVTFRKPDGGSIPKGEYRHGCTARHLLSGDVYQLFDGPVTIFEGNF